MHHRRPHVRVVVVNLLLVVLVVANLASHTLVRTFVPIHPFFVVLPVASVRALDDRVAPSQLARREPTRALHAAVHPLDPRHVVAFVPRHDHGRARDVVEPSNRPGPPVGDEISPRSREV